MRRHALLLALVGGLTAAPARGQTAAGYDKPGPYPVKAGQSGPGCDIFRPADLGQTRHPIILWGNGAGSMSAHYLATLRQWASYGFVVAGAANSQTASGRPLLLCLDFLAAENARAGSVFMGKLDLDHVGAAGHSLGGAGAIMAGRDPRITATAPIQPATQAADYKPDAPADQHGPMLLLSGSADVIAPPERQRPVFETANVPVVWAVLLGAGHNLPASPDGGPYRPVTTAWFLARLAADPAAAALFAGPACPYCRDPNWVIQRRPEG